MRTHQVLLIEDSKADAVLLRRALMREDTKLEFYHVDTAEAGFAYLREKLHNPSTLPNLIILDLNLPGINGLEFLRTYKAQDALRFVPVIVMTSSDHPIEVRRAYEAGANGYVKKPTENGRYDHIAKCLTSCWLDLMELPQGEIAGVPVNRFANI